MIVQAELYVEVRHTVFTLDTDNLDRNYEDEDYAYWIVEDENGYIHEMNIDKDEKGNFLMTGHDIVWFDRDYFDDGCEADVSEPITFAEDGEIDIYPGTMLIEK